ncbi:MAG: putative RDD family membrane protein YckC [Rickettsiales bacterium]|jgi:uncharacterized RDD family membrane protein YckC
MELDFKKIGSVKRGFANAIDVIIANALRIIVVLPLFNLWVKPKAVDFRISFKEKFDSHTIGRDPDKIQFLMNDPVFKSIIISCLIVFLIGALYYIIFNCSKWRGTIGKQLMGVVIIKRDGNKLDFLESLSHYSLSIVPWFYAIYIFAYTIMHQTNMYNAIADNLFNLILGFVSLIWLQFHLISKKKNTIPDLLCKTIMTSK